VESTRPRGSSGHKRQHPLRDIPSARVHIAHISTKHSLDAVKRSKKENISITLRGDTAPSAPDRCTSHFIRHKYEDEPTLRSQEDVDGIGGGSKLGDYRLAIATDQCPHNANDKMLRIRSSTLRRGRVGDRRRAAAGSFSSARASLRLTEWCNSYQRIRRASEARTRNACQGRNR